MIVVPQPINWHIYIGCTTKIEAFQFHCMQKHCMLAASTMHKNWFEGGLQLLQYSTLYGIEVKTVPSLD